MLKQSILGALLVGGMLALGASSGSATIAGPQFSEPTTTGGIIQVAEKKKWVNKQGYERRGLKKRWAYDRHRHGPRYRYRHSGYNYYYGGYYYSRPWWTLVPNIVIQIH